MRVLACQVPGLVSRVARPSLGAPAIALAVLALAPASALGATITVNTEFDSVADDGRCSLREAIRSANLNSASGASAGECAAGDANDTIDLPAGDYLLTRAGFDNNANAGDLDIGTGTTAVDGAGATATTVDAGRLDRVFDIGLGATVALEELTVTGGRAPDGDDAGVAPPGADGGPGAAGGPSVGGVGDAGADGGGIRNNGTLAISASTISGNAAGDGGAGGDASAGGDGGNSAAGNGGAGGMTIGGIGGAGGDGGGILSSGTLSIDNSTISENDAGDGGRAGRDGNAGGGGNGGGAAGNGGAGGTVIGGVSGAGGDGGGIASTGAGTLTITNSTIAANRAGDGGDLPAPGTAGDGGDGSGTGNGGGGGTWIDGVGGAGGRGGGIGSTSVFELRSSTVRGNTTGSGGDGTSGGTAGDGGTGGAGTGSGGAGGTALGDIAGSGGSGGGIQASAKATISSSTVSGNATRVGGDVLSAGSGGSGGGSGGGGGAAGAGGTSIGGVGGSGGDGSGIQLTAAASQVQTSTISGNSTGDGGEGGQGGTGPAASFGGIGGSAGDAAVAGAADLLLDRVTVAGNEVGTPAPAGAAGTGTPAIPGAAGSVATTGGVSNSVLRGSIVAGNAAPQCFSAPADGGRNITFPGTDCPGTSADPLLAPLADNGGPTKTRAVPDGSPALDQIPTGETGCPGTDQRGVPSPQGSACDSGAYELSRFAGIEILSNSSKLDSKRKAKVKALCPASTFEGCDGDLILKGKLPKGSGRLARAKAKQLGTKGFSLAPGQTKKIKVKVSKKAAGAVDDAGKLKTTAVATTTDGLGDEQTSKRKVKLKD